VSQHRGSNTMATKDNGACGVVRTLVAGGVDVMFANPGTTEMLGCSVAP
tara:strand:- start:420 stop:566 length:147 start_codon:yes stop_codon:yes gene_type:complete